MIQRRRTPVLLFLGLVLLLAPGRGHAAADPLEPLNRLMFALNMQLRGSGAGEVEAFYRHHVPAPVRQGVTNIFANLREPVTAVASLLGGDIDNARAASARFAINLTLGLGGYVDVAHGYGWVSRPETLGEILCSHGLPEGPMIVLPLLGTTTVPQIMGRVLEVVSGYQIFGRAYLPYRLSDRVVKVVNGEVGPLTGTKTSYEDERLRFWRERQSLCRNWPLPPRIVPLTAVAD